MSHQSLIEKSKWLRQELFELVMRAKKGHYPSSSSCADIMTALFYGGYMNLNKDNLNDRERDRIIISKGHAAMVLYPIFAELGFYPEEELQNFCKPESPLRMYADHTVPGFCSITGSLGHGLGIGAGFSLAAKRDNLPGKTWVVIGDGECYEGSVWETAMFASHYELDNLVAIVDRNQLCIMGETEKLIKMSSLEEKWRAFGWDAISIDGHNYDEIVPAIEKAHKNNTGKPVAIIANTIKGKGISFMEGAHLWHNRLPDEAQAEQARKELRQ